MTRVAQPKVRDTVCHRAVRDGTLDDSSPLKQFPKTGLYVNRRIVRARFERRLFEAAATASLVLGSTFYRYRYVQQYLLPPNSIHRL
jgi:hypothetical protein